MNVRSLVAPTVLALLLGACAAGGDSGGTTASPARAGLEADADTVASIIEDFRTSHGHYPKTLPTIRGLADDHITYGYQLDGETYVFCVTMTQSMTGPYVVYSSSAGEVVESGESGGCDAGLRSLG